jgi:hypothetical protein
MIESNTLKFNNTCRFYLQDAITGELIQYEEIKNLVTNIGFQLTLDLLGGISSSSVAPISYGAIGTGVTAAAVTDTKLETEVTRNPIAYSRASNTGTFSLFFNTTEGNTTINEFGFFGGAATTATDSGSLFNHKILVTPIVKTSSYTLSIELDLTLS